MIKNLAFMLLTALAIATPATAHITVMADPIEGPVAVGQPFNVTVRFSEPCFEMPVETAAGNDQLTAILDPTAPAYATATSGETVAWTLEDCEPSTSPTDFGGQVRKAAVLTVVVDASAPGLVAVGLPVNYVDANGGSGEAALVNVTVAHYANGTLHAMAGDHSKGTHDAMADESMTDDHNGTSAQADGMMLPVSLHITYTTNAESLLTVEAASSTGEVHEIDAVAVMPPSFSNKSEAMETIVAQFQPPADWMAADLTFTAYLTPTVGGPRIELATGTLSLTNEADAMMEHDDDHEAGHDHDEESSGIPAPTFTALALALLAVAVLRRR